VLGSVRPDGFLLEEGPDSLVRTKPAAIGLCERLGVELIPTSSGPARSMVLRRGRLLPLPEGLQLLAPVRWLPFLRSPVVSWSAKLRMGLDLLLPRRRGAAPDDDETLASFVRRRLGREALERLAQPLVAGIFSGDPELLSLRATMPRLLDLESQHRSLLLALRREAAREAASAGASPAPVAGARYGLFVTPRDGMQALVDALSGRLLDVERRLSSAVRSVRPAGAARGWSVQVLDSEEEFDAVVVAAPAPVAARLLAEAAAPLSAELSTIPAASCATVNLGFRRRDVGHPLDGFGFVSPAVERRFAMACTFTSRKYEGRAGADTVAVRAFVGGALGPDPKDYDEQELARRCLDDLRPLLDLRGPPMTVHVRRHLDSQPQYQLGHLARVARIEALEAGLPGLALCGNGYRGVGVADCVESAQRAVGRLLAGWGPR
jgi:oxygen-dependent protoporphyrinogen oxidase